MGKWGISTECRASLWAAGMGSPPGSPYTVGVRGPTENQRNGIVEIFVFKTVGLNVRLQRSRGEPQARHPAWSALISEIDGVGAAPGLRSNPVRSARSGNIPFATDKMPPEPPVGRAKIDYASPSHGSST